MLFTLNTLRILIPGGDWYKTNPQIIISAKTKKGGYIFQMPTPTLNPNEPIKVSRAGKEIGEFRIWEIAKKLDEAFLLPTDHYWQNGMKDWKLVIEIYEASQRWGEEIAKRERATKNHYSCHTCRATFKEYTRVETQWGMFFFLMFIIAIVLSKTAVLLFPVAILLFILSYIICIFISGLTEPRCPICNSSNISRPPEE